MGSVWLVLSREVLAQQSLNPVRVQFEAIQNHCIGAVQNSPSDEKLEGWSISWNVNKIKFKKNKEPKYKEFKYK